MRSPTTFHKLILILPVGLIAFGTNSRPNLQTAFNGEDRQDGFQKFINNEEAGDKIPMLRIQAGVQLSYNNGNTSTISLPRLNIQQAIDEEKITPMHWNKSTQINPPTIYFCAGGDGNGYKEAKHVMSNVLPEYIFHDMSKLKMSKTNQRMPIKYFKPNYTNEYDVFIITYFGICDVNIHRWLLTHFNGHVVFFSPESMMYPIGIREENARADRIHAFGPSDTERKGDIIIRYLQMTWWAKFQNMLPQRAMIDPNQRPKSTKENFMIYGNTNCVQYREEAVGKLSQLGIVHYDGKCKGIAQNRTNLVQVDNGISLRNWWTNTKLYHKYRFCFVMEHIYQRGYVTEKILMAFMGGCIPIYYGSVEIFDIFNKESFVFYNISNPQPALDLVEKLESNETRYEEMMGEPIAANGKVTIEEYFSFNNSIGDGVLKKRIREKLSLSHLVP